MARRLRRRREPGELEAERDELCWAVSDVLGGEWESGRMQLRDYIKEYVGFENLAAEVDLPAKSLIRMFGPRGNPQVRHLLRVIGFLAAHVRADLYVGWARKAK